MANPTQVGDDDSGARGCCRIRVHFYTAFRRSRRERPRVLGTRGCDRCRGIFSWGGELYFRAAIKIGEPGINGR
jgi:hypothetical protein